MTTTATYRPTHNGTEAPGCTRPALLQHGAGGYRTMLERIEEGTEKQGPEPR